jgi:hypothetical protein
MIEAKKIWVLELDRLLPRYNRRMRPDMSNHKAIAVPTYATMVGVALVFCKSLYIVGYGSLDLMAHDFWSQHHSHECGKMVG